MHAGLKARISYFDGVTLSVLVCSYLHLVRVISYTDTAQVRYIFPLYLDGVTLFVLIGSYLHIVRMIAYTNTAIYFSSIFGWGYVVSPNWFIFPHRSYDCLIY